MTEEEKKAIKREYDRIYYQRNKERIKDYSRKYGREHRAELQQKRRAKYHADPKFRQRVLATGEKYQKSDKGKTKRKEWRDRPDNKEKKRLANMEYAQLNKDKRHEYYIMRKIRLYGD